MRKYRSGANSTERIGYGLELAAGLSQFPETEPLVKPMQDQTAALEAAQVVRTKADRALLPVRVQIRFADWRVDQAIRSMSRMAEVADGGSRGPISRGLFPDGIGPLVTPGGQAQIPATDQFLIRAKACTVAGADKVCQEWLPKVEQARDELAKALEARDDAMMALGVTRATEEAAQHDHELAVEKVMGEVRSAFPKEKARWDVIFPAAGPTRANGGEQEEAAEEPAKTATPA